MNMQSFENFFPYYIDCTRQDDHTIRSHIEQERDRLQADKALLEHLHTLAFDAPFSKEDGRYQLTYQGVFFDFFFKSRQSDRLYVFLDGARSRNRGTSLAPLPNYISWSWYPKIEANILCFEDPMYYTFPDLHLGWFFGTEHQDYRKLLGEVIDRIACQLDIRRENIVLYGRSGGGTAALFTAQYLPGCTAVGVNPQINLTAYSYYPSFQSITGLDLTKESLFCRTDLISCIRQHPETHYIVLGNLLSSEDMSHHVIPLCNQLNILPSYGATRKENVIVWLFQALGPSSPHNSFENLIVFQLIDLVIRCSAEDCAAIPAIARYANEIWFQFSSQDRRNSQCLLKLAKTDDSIQFLEREREESKATIQEQASQIKSQIERLQEQTRQLEKKSQQLEKRDRQSKEQKSQIRQLNTQIGQLTNIIQKQQKQIAAAEHSFLYRCVKRRRQLFKKIRLFFGFA